MCPRRRHGSVGWWQHATDRAISHHVKSRPEADDFDACQRPIQTRRANDIRLEPPPRRALHPPAPQESEQSILSERRRHRIGVAAARAADHPQFFSQQA